MYVCMYACYKPCIGGCVENKSLLRIHASVSSHYDSLLHDTMEKGTREANSKDYRAVQGCQSRWRHAAISSNLE